MMSAASQCYAACGCHAEHDIRQGAASHCCMPLVSMMSELFCQHHQHVVKADAAPHCCIPPMSILSMPSRKMLHHSAADLGVLIPDMTSEQMLHYTASRLMHIIVRMMSEQMLQYSLACFAALQTIFTFGHHYIIVVIITIITIVIVVIVFILIPVFICSM